MNVEEATTLADEYVFIDEWNVDAPQEEVFDALADARTYPEWWRPVYITVEADCPPQVGCVSRQEFKGRLPYHLNTRSEIVRLDPARVRVSVIGTDGQGDPGPRRRKVPSTSTGSDRRPAALQVLTPCCGRCSMEPQLVDQAGDRGPQPYARSASSS